MKRHRLLQTALLTLLSVLLCAASALGSGESTIVTLSYLNGSYAGQLGRTFAQALSGLDGVCEAALSRLGGQDGGDTDVSGYSSSDTFATTLYPLAGETVTLGALSGLMWYSGSGFAAGPLLDVTDGAELPALGALKAGHRYLCEAETVITASTSASCAVQGLWRTTATGSPPLFSDVAVGEWYYEGVRYVVERSLFNGTGAGRFSPMTTMDRSMLVTVLYRLAGQPEVTGANPFTDVEPGLWYTSAVIWAAQAGIVTGTPASAFRPDSPVTREQIAVMFQRFAAYIGRDTSQRADLTGYSDCASVSGYAEQSLQWAVGAGLFQGSAGRLNPGGSAMRCEVATLFQRLDALLYGK